MSEIEGLKNRVDAAVEQLSSVNNARHEQTQNLTTLLGNLEEKFSDRAVELEYCNSQINALTQENANLSGLLERLVGIIGSGSEVAEDDPLVRASAMAASLLEGWTAAEAAPAVGSVDSQSNISVAQEDISMSFEDVSEDELEAETLDAPEEGLPETVAEAIAEAQNFEGEEPDVGAVGDAGELSDMLIELQEIVHEEVVPETLEDVVIENTVGDDIEIPESELDGDLETHDTLDEEIEDDAESSIRAMMDRLEQAARDAKFSSEDDSENNDQVPATDASEQVA